MNDATFKALTAARLANVQQFKETGDATAYLANSRAAYRQHAGEVVSSNSALALGHSPPARQTGQFFDQQTSGVLTALSGAATAAPEFLPAIAAAGVGYGVYKLGHSFDWW
jgi:hypothetical protein